MPLAQTQSEFEIDRRFVDFGRVGTWLALSRLSSRLFPLSATWTTTAALSQVPSNCNRLRALQIQPLVPLISPANLIHLDLPPSPTRSLRTTSSTSPTALHIPPSLSRPARPLLVLSRPLISPSPSPHPQPSPRHEVRQDASGADLRSERLPRLEQLLLRLQGTEKGALPTSREVHEGRGFDVKERGGVREDEGRDERPSCSSSWSTGRRAELSKTTSQESMPKCRGNPLKAFTRCTDVPLLTPDHQLARQGSTSRRRSLSGRRTTSSTTCRRAATGRSNDD